MINIAKDEELSSECEAAEIIRIWGQRQVDEFNNHDVVIKVYNKVQARFHSVGVGLSAIYLMGYIYGIRAERKRRAENKTTASSNDEVINTISQLSPSNLIRLNAFVRDLLKNQSH